MKTSRSTEEWEIKSPNTPRRSDSHPSKADFTSFSLKFCNLNILHESRDLSRNSWKPRWIFFRVVKNVEAFNICEHEAGRGHVILFLSLCRYKCPTVCVWSLTLILPHALLTTNTGRYNRRLRNALTPSNDPGSGNILITVAPQTRTNKTNCLDSTSVLFFYVFYLY